MNTTSRSIIIALAIKFKGDYKNILDNIREKREEVSEEEIAQAENIKCITILDDNYPEKLRTMYQPPIVLFYKGDISLLNSEETIAVAGSRNPKEETIRFTKRFVAKQNDKVIVSGLSKGTDTIALKTALKSGNKVIAVLGSGIDYCYPKENQALYNEIAEKGLIVSEYPFDTLPQKENFPMRNRIISGLAKAVCVMDLTKYSSSMVLVNYAFFNNKEIFVKPDLEEEDNVANELINQGANCLTLSTTI